MQKGGGIMRTSSFEHIVRLQFNALMMIVMKGTLSSHRRQSARRSKHEVLFCELPEMKQIENSMNDNYSHEFVSFQVLNFVIRISDEKLSTALKELTEKTAYCYLVAFLSRHERQRDFRTISCITFCYQ